MSDFSVYLVLGLAAIFCVLTLWIINYSQKYIQMKGIQAGMTQEEIKRWQLKSLVYGGLFGVYLFKKELSRKKQSEK